MLKYSVFFIILKDDIEIVDKIKVVIEFVYKEGEFKFKGNGKFVLVFFIFKILFCDGDLECFDDEVYCNVYFVNVNLLYKFGVVDVN